jgi:hypothetical protein
MNPKYVIIIALILIIIFLSYKKENFSVCDDIKRNCGLIDPSTTAGRYDCLSCSSCGVCTRNSKSICVNGNKDGPLFESNCHEYQYGRDPPITYVVESKITPDLDYSYQDVLTEDLYQTDNLEQTYSSPKSSSMSSTTPNKCDKLCQNKPITNVVDSINCENCPNCGILTFAKTDYCIGVGEDDYKNITNKVYKPIKTTPEKIKCVDGDKNAILKGFNKNSKYEVCLELQ